MQFYKTIACGGLVGLTIASSTSAMAQSSSVNFHVAFAGYVDCTLPIPLNNIPVRIDGTGVMNADGSGTSELTQTAFVLSTKINFEGRLGAAPSTAPGGTAQLRVARGNSLQMTWFLPNNQFMIQVTVNDRNKTCSTRFDARLNPGKNIYTLFDGTYYHYCGRPRLSPTLCEVR